MSGNNKTRFNTEGTDKEGEKGKKSIQQQSKIEESYGQRKADFAPHFE